MKGFMSRGKKREETRRQTPMIDSRRSSLCFQSIKVQALRLSAVVSHLVPFTSSKRMHNSDISRVIDGDVKLEETNRAAICSNRDLEVEGDVPHIHTVAKFPCSLDDSSKLLSNVSIEIDAGEDRDVDDVVKHSEQHIQ